MKKCFIFLMLFTSLSCFAAPPFMNSCAHALPTSDPQFCASFKSVASCYCNEHKMPSNVCNNMKLLFNTIVSVYGWPGACSAKAQHDTSPQECVDDWNSYNSHCSSMG